jgi:hypothetical protein
VLSWKWSIPLIFDRATRRFRLIPSWTAAAALALGASVLLPGTALSQSVDGGSVVVDPTAAPAPDVAPPTEPGDGTSLKTGRAVTPMLIPIPMKNTQLGWGLMLMGGLIHRFDPDTTIKPSTAMAGGFATENGSWGLMAIEDARLAHDRWRLRGMLAHMEIRYDYFGIGQDAGEAGKSVGIQQNILRGSHGALHGSGHRGPRHLGPGTAAGRRRYGPPDTVCAGITGRA